MKIDHAMCRIVACAVLGAALCSGAAHAADALAWFDGDRPGVQARQAVDLLMNASSHGLEPGDYAAATLQQAVALALQGAPTDAATAQRVEQGLTLAMQRYISDLHQGRVDPRDLQHDFDPAGRDGFDAAAVLQAALQARRIDDLPRDLAPRLPLYERLRGELARYRALADDPAWLAPLPPLPRQATGGSKLDPGQPYAGLAMLAQRLVALSDLAPSAPLPPLYEGPLVAAVMGFQSRHGLASDGVIGKATLTQLQVMPQARARQIELMLERLRWTPLTQRPRVIVINIPEFVLRAYEVHDGRIRVQLEMKVIVGKAYHTRTPVFDEDMRFIEFSPYWNVPPSIARDETVPKLRRDPAYFESEGFEFVSPEGKVHTTLSAERLDAVLAGRMRIRQRPGPTNALGDIKFVFPNRANIYLHHTPATQLFEQVRRDFSHGCIRVEQPVALASFVLQGMPEWTEERIRQAMRSGASTTLKLAAPLPVLIAYGTALVRGGRTYFFDDVYGLDRKLDAALRRRPPLAWRMQ
ncbi:MAG TPA: L,D-transpeptidase family protein [Rubrivivax sp.]|nr:L,D-transpeptidase family protein [Rubrivivax sp.]